MNIKQIIKKIILISLALLLFCGTVNASTYTVCASGCDYITIQAAVTAASSYDTVYVYNGTYTENIAVGTAHLTVEGEGRDVVTVNAFSSNNPVFHVTMDYVNISGFTIEGIGTNPLHSKGIEINANNFNISNNIITNHNDIGIMVSASDGLVLGNIISYNEYGISTGMSNGNTVSANTLLCNGKAVSFGFGSGNNNLKYNIFSRNRVVSYIPTTIVMESNRFLDEVSTVSQLEDVIREGSIGTPINFAFTIKNEFDIDCPSCTYIINVSPPEVSLQHQRTIARITGNFTPTRLGIYSLNINVTDGDNNTELRKYTFLINATGTEVTKYYFREVLATHGQPTGYGTDHDAGALLFEPPSSDEVVWCAAYIGVSIDQLPNNLLGIFKNINYSIYYKATNMGNTGIQKCGDYSATFDESASIDASPIKKLANFTFPVNWENDYVWTWYKPTVKMSTHEPYIYSNATHPSYANITYTYSTTPAVKSISNKDVLFLSATSLPGATNNTSIIFGGVGSTHLVIQMPNSGIDYNATYDGSLCNDGNCSFTQSNGELNFTLTLESVHTLNITGNIVTPPDPTKNIFNKLITIITDFVGVINSILTLFLSFLPLFIGILIFGFVTFICVGIFGKLKRW